MAGAHIFQNSARTVYSSNLTDIQERTRGTTALTGGYYSALLNVVVIVVVPLLGVFFDKVGWRMPFGAYLGSSWAGYDALADSSFARSGDVCRRIRVDRLDEGERRRADSPCVVCALAQRFAMDQLVPNSRPRPDADWDSVWSVVRLHCLQQCDPRGVVRGYREYRGSQPALQLEQLCDQFKS